MKTLRCILKKDKEKPLEGRHPWVFSGAIDRIDDSYTTGDLVKVYSAAEAFLGVGYLNPRSQIAIRMLAFEDVAIDADFFEKRIQEAILLREKFLPPETNAYRLIHSEGDFLPGLIVDRYADYLVLQIQTAGMEVWRETIVGILERLELPSPHPSPQRGEGNPCIPSPHLRGEGNPCIPSPRLRGEGRVRGIYERDDIGPRELEGLPKRVGRLAGEEPPDYVEIQENGVLFLVDIHEGQKTGFFLDQRENRKLVGNLARGRRVLNCFAYTSGFSLYAASGGATETVSVESSEAALNTARANFEKNGFTGPAHQFVKEDVFQYLRSSRQEFDLIVLDPPAFCKHKGQIQQAARGYKDINLYAMKRLAAGGILFTSSCSSFIDPDLFQKIIFGAAKDARKNVRILTKTSHPFDHPINIYHPEGEYLKGLLCQVD